MLRADLGQSWPLWASASVLLCAIQFVAVFSALVVAAGLSYGATASGSDRQLVLDLLGILASVGTMAGIFAFMMSAVVVNGRVRLSRAQLSLWILAGATPGQVIRLLIKEALLVSAMVAPVGAYAAWAIQPIVMSHLVEWGLAPSGLESSSSWIATLTGLAVGAILVGCGVAYSGWKQAGRISPIEAQRPTLVGERSMSKTRRNWLLVLVSFTAFLMVAPMLAKDSQSIASAPLWTLVLAAAAVGVGAPVLLPRVVKTWTYLVPKKAVTWVISAETAPHRIPRVAAMVIPLSLAFGFPVGVLTLSRTMAASLAQASGRPVSAMQISDLAILAIPMVIVVAGAASGLALGAQQRKQDIALISIMGATPAQGTAQAFFEGLIGAVTAIAVGSACVIAALISCTLGLVTLTGGIALQVPWFLAAVTALAVLIAATAASTLGSLAITGRSPRSILANPIES